MGASASMRTFAKPSMNARDTSSRIVSMAEGVRRNVALSSL
jgi:hypothetical protein